MTSSDIDVLIRSAKVVDGTGNPWFYGDIAISKDRIREIALPRRISAEVAREVVDATGMVVCPGFIDTTMTRGIPDAIREQQLAKIPLGRAGQPADVAAVVAFLASDEAGYITGEVINVGGGYIL